MSRVINKSWYYLHSYIFRHFGYGCNVRKDVWEREYNSNHWNYLEGEAEQGRYLAIINFYRQHSPSGEILDIGCGEGVLYKYLKSAINLPVELYTGIDISETAIATALNHYPNANFTHLDYDKNKLSKKFNVVIFNETLYYFNRPVNTLKKCFRSNLKENGYVIVSLYNGDANPVIWKQIEKRFKVVDAKQIINEKNYQWHVKVITTKPEEVEKELKHFSPPC
jgi:2-polyprenyl-3-methyl-5-hydroxy-6-metoxy-1,4-benzoquinol methylase